MTALGYFIAVGIAASPFVVWLIVEAFEVHRVYDKNMHELVKRYSHRNDNEMG